ncbi:MAG: carboxypeptidase regulatory-like domain-containing protein [Candidatus Stygibacter frigidus]|nr:carboxypeptidase regulatory-like domain-containing protein [Candidatus Stygibacter frigidus]
MKKDLVILVILALIVVISAQVPGKTEIDLSKYTVTALVREDLILNFDNVLPEEQGGYGCFDWEENGASLSMIPNAGEGWECNGENDPSWYYSPGEMTMYPGRIYVDLSSFDVPLYQVDVTLTDYCDIGCTQVAGTMGQEVYITNANIVTGEETHVIINNDASLALDGFYIDTYEGIIHEINVSFTEITPPELTIDLPDNGIMFDEDSQAELDLANYIIGSNYTITFAGNNNIAVNVSGTVAQFVPSINWFGTETVTFTVSDETNRTIASDDLVLTVNSINDAPWIDLPDELVINTAIDPIPYAFDISGFYGDVDDEELFITVSGYTYMTVVISGNILSITPDQGLVGYDNLDVTVTDTGDLSSFDTMSIQIIGEVGTPELIFDISDLEAGPINFGVDWMFDTDNTPFVEDQDINSMYAYQAFNWNIDGHGNGSCDSGGSGVITDEICVSESLPFASDVSELGLFIDSFALTSYEHINTENPGQPWDTMGEAGDQRQYTDGIGTITHNGSVVLSVTDIIYNVTTYYPAPIGNGGASGYGTVEGEGYIDVDSSDPQWVDFYDQNGSGLIYFSCGSMSPVLQMCFGTYDVNDLIIYGTEVQNQAPVLYLPNQFSFDEDGSLAIDISDYAIDPDDDPLTVTVLNNEMISAQVIGMNVILSAPANWNGSETITIMVDDGYNRAVASDDTEVIVNPVNDAPWINLPDEITIDPNIDPLPYSFDVSAYCGDVDGDLLTMTVVTSNEVSVTIDGLTLIIDPVFFDSQALITITVSDPGSLIAIDNFNVNIGNYITAISGQVYEAESRPPISDVEITLTDNANRRESRQSGDRLTFTTYTDEYGAYYMEVDPGTYTLTATHPDYQTVSVSNLFIEENTTLQYFFGMNPATPGYITSGLYTTGCEYNDGFNGFSFGSMQNLLSGCSSDDVGYGDFTDMSETVYAGDTVDVNLLTGYDYNYAMIWVDFNQDYSFTEDEIILGSTLMVNGNTITTQANIPEWALPGEYRMRARAVYNVTPFTASGSYDFGEVEDYTLVVSEFNPPELTIDLPDNGIMFDEDSQAELDLADYITGSNYTVTFAGNDNISVSLTGTVAQFVPNTNWFGTETITFTVSDETSRTTVSDDLIVTINGINDAPYIDLPTQLSFYTYGPRVRDLAEYFGDVDGDDLTISVTDNDSIEVEIIGSIIHLLSDDGWTGTDTWTITVDDGVSRATAYDIVNIQVGDVLILNLDDVLPEEQGGYGCFDWEEDGALLSVIPNAGEGWECNGENDPSWYYSPGEVTLYPGRLYVDLSYFDLHWFQVDVTLTDNCDIGCTEVVGTMGQDSYMTNANTVTGEETHVTIVNGMGMDLDGFYINTYEGIIHEIHVYFADQNPTYIGGNITDLDTGMALTDVVVTIADTQDSTMVYTGGTGADGNFYVEVEPATYNITFDCAGYDSQYYYDVTLAEGDFVDYNIAMEPVSLPITLSRELVPGWNWISLNLVLDDLGVNAVLNSIGDSGVNIKNQTSFAIYYPGSGWIGSMTGYNLASFYKIQMNDLATWEITGTPVDVNEFPISLSAGWNWIPYLPQSPMEINAALNSISIDASQIKGSNKFATYYPGSGWYGSLQELEPLFGYMLNMNNDATLVYPGDYVRNNNIDVSEQEAGNEDAGWQINAAEYEYNGSIVAHIDGMATGDVLAAFAGDECRGIGEVLDSRAIFGHLTFALMAYTNETENEELSFRYYNSVTGEISELQEKIIFTPDAVIGGFDAPLQLTMPASGDDQDTPAMSSLVSCIPNPFNPSGTIYYTMSEDAEVNIAIYNIRGQKIATLVSGYQSAGEHNITWNGSDQSGNNVASGLYFVKMNTGKYQDMNKIILLK